jgi:hypothetical protein
MADANGLSRATKVGEEKSFLHKLREDRRETDPKKINSVARKIAELQRQFLLQADGYPFLSGQLTSALQELLEGKHSELSVQYFQAVVDFSRPAEDWLAQGNYFNGDGFKQIMTEERVNNFDRIFFISNNPRRSLGGVWKITYVLFGFRYCPTDEEIDEVLASNYRRVASAKEMLAFGALFPKVQKKFPIVQSCTFPLSESERSNWGGGKLCLTTMSGNKEERILRINNDQKRIWADHPQTGCRFLAVDMLEEIKKPAIA